MSKSLNLSQRLHTNIYIRTMSRNEKHKNKLVCTYKLTPCTEKQASKNSNLLLTRRPTISFIASNPPLGNYSPRTKLYIYKQSKTTSK